MADALVDKGITKWKTSAGLLWWLAAIARFSDSPTKLHQVCTAVSDNKATAVSLPNDTGWN
jgi:hypothetical protein